MRSGDGGGGGGGSSEEEERGTSGQRSSRGLMLAAGSCYTRCKKLMRKRVPIVRWLPQYNMEKCVSDAIAGVTVGLTVMPQGLAYAILAGLEPQVIIRQL